MPDEGTVSRTLYLVSRIVHYISVVLDAVFQNGGGEETTNRDGSGASQGRWANRAHAGRTDATGGGMIDFARNNPKVQIVSGIVLIIVMLQITCQIVRCIPRQRNELMIWLVQMILLTMLVAWIGLPLF